MWSPSVDSTGAAARAALRSSYAPQAPQGLPEAADASSLVVAVLPRSMAPVMSSSRLHRHHQNRLLPHHFRLHHLVRKRAHTTRPDGHAGIEDEPSFDSGAAPQPAIAASARDGSGSGRHAFDHKSDGSIPTRLVQLVDALGKKKVLTDTPIPASADAGKKGHAKPAARGPSPNPLPKLMDFGTGFYRRALSNTRFFKEDRRNRAGPAPAFVRLAVPGRSGDGNAAPKGASSSAGRTLSPALGSLLKRLPASVQGPALVLRQAVGMLRSESSVAGCLWKNGKVTVLTQQGRHGFVIV
jgi:hypothetical protein